MAAAESPYVARFYRRLIAGMSVLFGAGSLFTNIATLLAPPEARLPGDPVALLGFHAAMGALYLVIAWGVGWDRVWAARLIWIVAILHALAASIAAVAYVLDADIRGSAVMGAMLREGFWVLIGVYWSRRSAT